jgi:hypothetical protein
MKFRTLVLWKFDFFDRLVLKDWRLERQHLCMDQFTSELVWRKAKRR